MGGPSGAVLAATGAWATVPLQSACVGRREVPHPDPPPPGGRAKVDSFRMPLTATRTLVLMPVAIALNIMLGSTVQQALKLPIYLDSLGTVITGVLAGPLAGLATGALTDLLWAYVLPPPAAAPTA